VSPFIWAPRLPVFAGLNSAGQARASASTCFLIAIYGLAVPHICRKAPDTVFLDKPCAKRPCRTAPPASATSMNGSYQGQLLDKPATDGSDQGPARSATGVEAQTGLPPLRGPGRATANPLTLNQRVRGSSPWRHTIRTRGQQAADLRFWISDGVNTPVLACPLWTYPRPSRARDDAPTPEQDRLTHPKAVSGFPSSPMPPTGHALQCRIMELSSAAIRATGSPRAPSRIRPSVGQAQAAPARASGRRGREGSSRRLQRTRVLGGLVNEYRYTA